MSKLGLKLLFWTFSQIIFVIIAYEFYLRYAQVSGGHGYVSAFNAIHPLIKLIVIIELIISLRLFDCRAAWEKAQKWFDGNA